MGTGCSQEICDSPVRKDVISRTVTSTENDEGYSSACTPKGLHSPIVAELNEANLCMVYDSACQSNDSRSTATSSSPQNPVQKAGTTVNKAEFEAKLQVEEREEDVQREGAAQSLRSTETHSRGARACGPFIGAERPMSQLSDEPAPAPICNRFERANCQQAASGDLSNSQDAARFGGKSPANSSVLAMSIPAEVQRENKRKLSIRSKIELIELSDDPPPEPIERTYSKEQSRTRRVIKAMANSADKNRKASRDSTMSRESVESVVQGRFSHDLFWNPKQTVVIVDWDDTLFPTTWLKFDNGLKISQPLSKSAPDVVKEGLMEVESYAYDFLLAATSYSDHVVIVTLGQEPWVGDCIRNFGLDSLATLIEEKEIEIVYARSFQKVHDDSEYDKRKFQCDKDVISYWAGVKARAIESVCAKSYRGRSWKNIISVGDSVFEQEGTRQAIKTWCQANQRTAYQIPRTKTVKFIDEPTAEELSDQLKLMYNWLPELVKLDEAFNIDLDGAGNDNLRGIAPLITPAASDGDALSQGPTSALIVGRLWKLVAGGNSLCEDDWLRRRVWLSWKGQLWYECLEEAKPFRIFPVQDGMLKAAVVARGKKAVVSIGGYSVFPFEVHVVNGRNSTSDQGALLEDLQVAKAFLATDSEEEMEEWIRVIESHSPKGGFTCSSDIAIGAVD